MDTLFEELKGKYDGNSGPNSGGITSDFGSLTEAEINFYGLDKGSFDNGDPTTTNLYVGNLNPTTTGIFGVYTYLELPIIFPAIITVRGRFNRFIRTIW